MANRIVLVLIFAEFLLSSPVWARQCYTREAASSSIQQKPSVQIVVDGAEHPHFNDPERKCRHYWEYFSGKVRKPDGTLLTQADCRKSPELVRLSDGYAPLGVFMRSKVLSAQTKVRGYHWEIHGPVANKSGAGVKRYDSFDAAHVFDQPGQYEAKLRVTFEDGSRAEDRHLIHIWPRDRATYYVDAALGDDRYDGKATEPDPKCRPDGRPAGVCTGPWKTATRAFTQLSPRDWRGREKKDYQASSACLVTAKKPAYRYPDGDYFLYRGQGRHFPEALRNDSGQFVPPYDAEVCEQLAPVQPSLFKPGDRVLFRRGQKFDFETGILAVERSKRVIDQQSFDFEKKICASLVTNAHWSMPNGILFAAFGSGERPLIQNTGYSSCMAFNLTGAGVMHLAFQDLAFDLEQRDAAGNAARASFMFAVAHPIGLLFNRISLSNFDQGIQFHNAKSFFVNDSHFHNSNVVHLYSETASDVFMAGNYFDYSGNHISYTNMSPALVTGNVFKRPAFGRTALRVFGSSLQAPTRSVWISDNVFEGWIDPRTSKECKDMARCPFADGKRYNYSLVELQPNNLEGEKFLERVVFTRNYLSKAENLLRFAGVDGLVIKSNIFDAPGDASGTPRVQLADMARRPSRDVLLEGNLFIERISNSKTSSSSLFSQHEYAQQPCDEGSGHQNIRISNNRLFPSTQDACLIQSVVRKTSQNLCLLSAAAQFKGNMPAGLSLFENKVFSGQADKIEKEVTAIKESWKRVVPSLP